MSNFPVDFTTPTTVPSAQSVTCTCGKKAVGECNCERAAVENPKCSCGRNAAGHCNCELAATENQSLTGQPTCSCGMRAAGACTCSHASTENAIKPEIAATVCSCHADEGVCVCAGGQCACSGCGRQAVTVNKA